MKIDEIVDTIESGLKIIKYDFEYPIDEDNQSPTYLAYTLGIHHGQVNSLHDFLARLVENIKHSKEYKDFVQSASQYYLNTNGERIMGEAIGRCSECGGVVVSPEEDVYSLEKKKPYCTECKAVASVPDTIIKMEKSDGSVSGRTTKQMLHD